MTAAPSTPLVNFLTEDQIAHAARLYVRCLTDTRLFDEVVSQIQGLVIEPHLTTISAKLEGAHCNCELPHDPRYITYAVVYALSTSTGDLHVEE